MKQMPPTSRMHYPNLDVTYHISEHVWPLMPLLAGVGCIATLQLPQHGLANRMICRQALAQLLKVMLLEQHKWPLTCW